MTALESLHVVCPHCQRTNRLAKTDLTATPNCGSCHQALFTGAPVALDAHSFAKHVGRSHLPVVVDFWAPWCGPCRMMAPAFAQAAQQLEPNVRFAKLDTEAHPHVAAPYNVRSIPTMIVFHHGVEKARISGALPAGEIVRWVRGQIGA